ncbi:type I restriction enzyme S subunit [Catalinimonas alkaloidigena]|uniref:restriction endonuclease subunit S n=1 Tax=Catalinimonas alkaloidigena TaxID=1075417 RepID=UPI0024070434|nr:restriction endonuclease subunit S [Catalinimonas alkaloidigena]MDF9801300.1 type I restriction enzyme S subunit [Catalinimonas alkaloidigena]
MMKHYPYYKDSGIDWLGQIPEHWEIKKIRYLGSFQNGISNSGDYFGIGYPFVSYGDAYKNMALPFEVTELANSNKVEQARYSVQEGDVFFTRTSETIEEIGFASTCLKSIEQATFSGFLIRFRQFKNLLDKNFSKFYFRNKLLRAFFSGEMNLVTRVSLSQDLLKNLPVIIPPLPEQRAIARFLDEKTEKIDALIAKKEELLKLLAEKRTALITRAVTKGLNPDAPMKDSGIPWLGEIPAHWVDTRLKFLTTKIIDGTHATPNYIDDGIPFLRVTDIVKAKGGQINLDNVNYISEDEHKDLTRRCKPEKYDLLYSKNGTIGVPRVIDWDFDFSIFVSLCLLKLKLDRINPHFLSYSLQSKLTENQISFGSKSSTVTNLHLDKIKEFVVSLPPKEEQEAIVSHLQKDISDIKILEKDIEDSITKLQEYRSSLITHAVTGKIDVREPAHQNVAV